jgi:hypothetical protein
MTKTVIEKAREFVRKIHEHEIVITENAREIQLGSRFEDKPHTDLATELAHSMYNFEISDDDNVPSATRLLRAQECLKWMNFSYSCGAINEGSGLVAKIKNLEAKVAELQHENEKQKEEAEKYATDLVFLQGKYEELNEKFGRMLPKDGAKFNE